MEYNYFDGFYDVFLDDLKKELSENNSNFNRYLVSKKIQENIMDEIRKAIRNVGLRCLVLEFQVWNKVNKIEGNNIREKAEYYKKKLAEDRNYCESILAIYPEIEPICQKLIQNQKKNIIDLLQKFERDKGKIFERFFPSEKGKTIEEIHIGQGDLHCEGKSVMEIRFEDGASIYYKPHSLAGDLLFYRIFNKIEGTAQDFYSEIPIIECIGYGWEKGERQRECHSEKEIRNFYERVGIILCISYLLGTHDLHYQNMIACGEYPFFIDLENIFQTDEIIFRVGESRSFPYSVLSSSILPSNLKDSPYCAVTGGNGGVSLYQVPMLKEKDDKLFITYGKPEMSAGKNRPGVDVEAINYLEEIENGFNYAYKKIMNMDETELLGMIPGDLRSRYLLHNTQLYHNILETSYHPQLLMKTGGREEFIRRLCPNEIAMEYEVEDLLGGDIPYFYRKADSKSLFTSSGREVKDYFKETMFEAIQRRKGKMNESDRELQCKLIRWSLDISRLSEDDFINDKFNVEEKKESQKEWHELAIEMADKIEREAIWNEEKTKVVWLSLRYSNEPSLNAQIGTCDYYLYEGLAGIILFMKAIQVSTGRYEDVCRAAENVLFEYTDSVYEGKRDPDSDYTGLYCGEGAIVYAYQALFRFTGERRFLFYAVKHAEILKRLLEYDKSIDILYGNAGAIIAFCGLYKVTNNIKYLEYAKEAEEFLRRNLQISEEGIFFCGHGMEKPCAGIAHGNSGLILAYGQLWQYTKEDIYTDVLFDLLSYENMLFIDRLKGVKETDWKTSQLPSWCHGDLGILWTYLKLKEMTGDEFDPETKMVLKNGEKILEKVVLRRSMGICHGNFGNLFLMKECGEKLQLGSNIISCFEKKIKKLLSKEVLLMPKEQMDYGLMQGISGIGYSCLKLHKKLI